MNWGMTSTSLFHGSTTILFHQFHGEITILHFLFDGWTTMCIFLFTTFPSIFMVKKSPWNPASFGMRNPSDRGQHLGRSVSALTWQGNKGVLLKKWRIFEFWIQQKTVISGWMKLELDGFKELVNFKPENLWLNPETWKHWGIWAWFYNDTCWFHDDITKKRIEIGIWAIHMAYLSSIKFS